MFHNGGRALDERQRAKARPLNQTPNAVVINMGVRLWGLSSMVARETAQIAV